MFQETARSEMLRRPVASKVVQLAKMKHLFKNDAAYEEFTGSVVTQIEENGAVVLLLDDERVLFGALPVGDAMSSIKEKIVERMISDPERLKSIIERLQDEEREEEELID